MEAGTKPIEVGRVISESFELYKQAAAALIGMAGLIFVAVGVLSGLFLDMGDVLGSFLNLLVNLIATALYTGFVVRVVQDVRADGRRDLTLGHLLRSASGSVGTLIVSSIVRAIAIAIGFALLIVPGLYLFTIWAAASPAIVAERKGVIESLGRSHDLVRGHGWTVFGCIVVAAVISSGIVLVLASVGFAIGGIGGAIAAGIVAGVLTAPIAALVSSILFFDLGGGSAAAPQAPAAPDPVV